MSQNHQPLIHPLELLSAIRTHKRLWIIPTLLLTVASVGYSFVMTPKWDATMPLLVRDEAVGVFRRPGQFESVDALKTAQETVLELARSRAVVAEALKKVGPADNYVAKSEAPEDQWPTKKDVETVQKLVKITPPKGSELGKTDIIYLTVRSTSTDRAIALTNAICDQVDERLQMMRDRKSKGVVDELSKTVKLARADLEQVTQSLSEVESQVGADLGELRLLSEPSGGASNLRQTLNEIKSQIIDARKRQKTNQEFLASLTKVKAEALKLTAVSAELLKMHPSLQRIKDSYVDATLLSAKYRSDFSEFHPKMSAANAMEEELRKHLDAELRDTIHALNADVRLTAGLIESLEQQQDDLQSRMNVLARLRAPYANLAADVRHHNEILRKSVADLSEARASQAASQISSQLTRIDEPATGSEPSGPSQAIVTLVGLLGGLFTGLGSVYARLSWQLPPSMNPVTLVPNEWVEPLREMVDTSAHTSWTEAVASVAPGRYRQS